LEGQQPENPFSVESKAITAIKQALAAPVQGCDFCNHPLYAGTKCKNCGRETETVQEPVAVVSGYYGGQCVVLPTNPARLFSSGTAFYTTPPAAQPAPVQCWKCGDMDAEFQAYCKVPACGMKENT